MIFKKLFDDNFLYSPKVGHGVYVRHFAPLTIPIHGHQNRLLLNDYMLDGHQNMLLLNGCPSDYNVRWTLQVRT